MMGLLVAGVNPGYFKENLGLVKYYKNFARHIVFAVGRFLPRKEVEGLLRRISTTSRALEVDGGLVKTVGSIPQDGHPWKSSDMKIIEEYNQPKTRRLRNVFFKFGGWVNDEVMLRFCTFRSIRSYRFVHVRKFSSWNRMIILKRFFFSGLTWKLGNSRFFLWCVSGVRCIADMWV